MACDAMLGAPRDILVQRAARPGAAATALSDIHRCGAAECDRAVRSTLGGGAWSLSGCNLLLSSLPQRVEVLCCDAGVGTLRRAQCAVLSTQ